MNTKLFILTVGTMLLVSCGHEADLVESREAYKEVVTQTNAEKVFGVKFDPNHDWCTTVSGQVMITADASVKKVQLLVDVLDITDESTPSYVTRNSMKVLNQAETSGRTNFTLYYDAPKDNLGLYVAFITDESLYLRKVENGAASFTSPAKTRGMKLDNGYTLPNASQFHVAGSEASWASQSEQGWNPGEVLYYLNDYEGLKMTAEGEYADYSTDFKTGFRKYILDLLPNGRWEDDAHTIPNDNTPGKVYNTVEYNNNCYVVTDGEQPVILTPMYKCDHPTKYGYEVWNSELYYYYYDPAQVSGDFVSYIQRLPKYKAIPFNRVFDKTEDEKVGKHGSFALLYFETPNNLTPATANTPASFIFPKGYKIGFMIKANTDADKGKKRGELYGDGRLNNYINNWGNFASSGFNTDDKKDFPRLYWLTFENKTFMSWESGTDRDFNDIFVEVEGGKVVPDIPVPDPEVYTYCFEDTEQGDFDLNDVVIKAIRVDETTIEYRIVACGAHDEVTVMNINVAPIVDGAEVHKLFGVDDPKTFINTDGSDYGYVSCRKTVPADFSFKDTTQQPYIRDITTNNRVRLATKGQNPHGIMIPGDFLYPTERTPVKTAYPDFNTWGMNSYLASDWYKNPIRSLVR
jgi:hypothetical protein